jgi:hypothetical protein
MNSHLVLFDQPNDHNDTIRSLRVVVENMHDHFKMEGYKIDQDCFQCDHQ